MQSKIKRTVVRLDASNTGSASTKAVRGFSILGLPFSVDMRFLLVIFRQVFHELRKLCIQLLQKRSLMIKYHFSCIQALARPSALVSDYLASLSMQAQGPGLGSKSRSKRPARYAV